MNGNGLTDILKRYGKVAVAFSGGLDSSVLLRAATDCLGKDNVLSITATALNFPSWEAEEARCFAAGIDCQTVSLPFDPFSVPEFPENGPRRCYYCKYALFTKLKSIAEEKNFLTVCDGTNADDLTDYRPGLQAVRELGIKSPFLEAGMGKTEIRLLASRFGLSVANKPSFACLASRIPSGCRITPEKLQRVESAEKFFLSMGLRNIRVRDHDGLARVEVDPAERRFFYDSVIMDKSKARLLELGFRYATLDMGGYSTGSVNPSKSPVQ